MHVCITQHPELLDNKNHIYLSTGVS